MDQLTRATPAIIAEDVSQADIKSLKSIYYSDLTACNRFFQLLPHYDASDAWLETFDHALNLLDTQDKALFLKAFQNPKVRLATYYAFAGFHDDNRKHRPSENTAIHSLRVAVGVMRPFNTEAQFNDAVVEAICAALLHDVQEDLSRSKKPGFGYINHIPIIAAIFGTTVASLVRSLTLPSTRERIFRFHSVIRPPVGFAINNHKRFKPYLGKLKKLAKDLQTQQLYPIGLMIKAVDNIDTLRCYRDDIPANKMPIDNDNEFVTILIDRAGHARDYLQRLQEVDDILGQASKVIIEKLEQQYADVFSGLKTVLAYQGINLPHSLWPTREDSARPMDRQQPHPISMA